MAFDLAKLGEAVIEVVRDEAAFLAMYESNWAGVYGLPGRRESHLVAALSAHLRHKYGTRSVLDDALWGCPNTRCDLAVQVDPGGADRWAWIEVKTVPVEDANDRLASVHGDILKLTQAAEINKKNVPHAVVVVGYDYGRGSLAPRLARFAQAHGLDRWLKLDDDVHVMDLPASPGNGRYTHAVIGVWVRRDARTKVIACDGRCHLTGTRRGEPLP